MGFCLFWSFPELLRLPRKSVREESDAPLPMPHAQALSLRTHLLPGVSSPVPATLFCSVWSQHRLSPSICTSVLHLCQWPARHSHQPSVSHLISFLSCLLILPSNKSAGGSRARRAAQTVMGYWVPPSCDLPACGPRPHPSPLLPLAFQPFLLLPQRPPRSDPPGNTIALPD